MDLVYKIFPFDKSPAPPHIQLFKIKQLISRSQPNLSRQAGSTCKPQRLIECYLSCGYFCQLYRGQGRERGSSRRTRVTSTICGLCSGGKHILLGLLHMMSKDIWLNVGTSRSIQISCGFPANTIENCETSKERQAFIPSTVTCCFIQLGAESASAGLVALRLEVADLLEGNENNFDSTSSEHAYFINAL